jgi:hypothetical protein
MGLNALTRELHANERPQLLTHLLALDAEDRHLRFALCCQTMVYAIMSKVST